VTLNETLQLCSQVFTQIPDYAVCDRLLRNVMDAHRLADGLEAVLLKATLVNALYATNVYDIVTIARHIACPKIGDALRAGSPEAVEAIAREHGIGKGNASGYRDFYVFATKYAHWHNPDAYPIYDSYVGWLLPILARHFPDEPDFSVALSKNGPFTQ